MNKAPECVQRFMKAVYGEHTNLALALFNETKALNDAAALIEQLRELMVQALRCLEYPDNGPRYCRWCSAGTHNRWQHDEYCSYVSKCRAIDAVRAKAKELD